VLAVALTFWSFQNQQSNTVSGNSLNRPLGVGIIWLNCLPPANCDVAYGGKTAYVFGIVNGSLANSCLTRLTAVGSWPTLPLYWTALDCQTFLATSKISYGSGVTVQCQFVPNPSEAAANISKNGYPYHILDACVMQSYYPQ